MTDTEHLESCPFCGGEAAKQAEMIRCVGCGVMMIHGNYGTDGTRWNTRTNLHQAELAAVIEKVAAEIEAVDYGYQETPDFYSGLSEAATVVRALTPPDATAALQAERDKAFNEGLEALTKRFPFPAKSSSYFNDEDVAQYDLASKVRAEIRALKRET